MNILGLLGNLPFAVLNCPSPSDYYEQGVRDTLAKIEREKHEMQQIKAMVDKNSEVEKGEI